MTMAIEINPSETEAKVRVISETVLNYFTKRDVAIVSLTMSEILEKQSRTKAGEIYAACKDKLSNPDLPEVNFGNALSINAAAGRLVGFHGARGRFGGWFRTEGVAIDTAALKAIVDAPETEIPGIPTGKGKGRGVGVKLTVEVAPKAAPKAVKAAPIASVDMASDIARLSNLLELAMTRGDDYETKLSASEAKLKDLEKHYQTATKRADELQAHLLKRASAEVDAKPAPVVVEVPRSERCFIWIGTDRYAVPKSENLVKGLITYVLDGTENEAGNIFVGESKYTVPDAALLERFLLWLDGAPKPIA